ALWSGSEREEIIVDRTTSDFLIKQRSELLLRPLTQTEEQDVIESFIEDEILFREAKKKGFDSSGRIRKLMIQNMRFFLASELPKPSEDDLRAFYKEQKVGFERPPSLSLDHVFFTDAKAVPETTLTTLRGGADPATFGDEDFKIGKRIAGTTQRQLVQLFGPGNARKIMGIDDAAWHGPIKSPLGVHFVRVTARTPAQTPPFEQARRWVEAEWLRDKQRALIEAELERARPNYRIEIEDRKANTHG
ncbi:MAG: peptidyl-prolyl cis-trans isomerase, partial [Rhizobiaceae bacterium]